MSIFALTHRFGTNSAINLLNKLSPSLTRYASTQAHERIKAMIEASNKRVFVFMKGVPKEPLCGYSGAVVKILDAYGVDYDSCDVLKDNEIRQEIKTYSDWPTIPQVYLDGSFVGGCDILLQMHQNGELKQLLENKEKSSENPETKV